MFIVSACGESNSNRKMAEGIFPDMSHSKNYHICLSKGKETIIVELKKYFILKYVNVSETTEL